MFTLRKKFTFEAAHKLPHHSGKCRRLHGHSWVATIVLQGPTLQVSGSDTGMLIDYSFIKSEMNPILEKYLDHHYLNETLPLESPTSENLAVWLYGELCKKIPYLVAVEIDETCTCSCEYRPDKK